MAEPKFSKRRSPPERRPGRRGCRGLLRSLFAWALALSLLASLALGVAYWWLVVANPGEHLSREQILQLISQESPVYYRDGEEKLGVFFAEEHRQYVPYSQIPKTFVDALVAAEDQDFFSHRGVSIRGIGRALVQNIAARRVVAGGSTLTQQTAKNLYKRQGRTLREKLRELLNALRLEHHYGKEDILEFYSNQFYVNGNGRGLAIAARFFFDKDVSQLDLVESAFLAGVVKSPNTYNPWVPGEERQQRALQQARRRTDYVLGRMLEDGSVDRKAYDRAVQGPVPFRRGRFRFDRSVVLDEVERELNGPAFQPLLASFGVEDLGTAGLRVTTTIDREIQEAAVYALRHHLTEIGILLEAPELERFFMEGGQLRPVDPGQLRPHGSWEGILVSVDAGARTSTVDLGGVQGTLDEAANERLARLLRQAREKNSWATVGKADVSALLTQVAPHQGDRVRVSVREMDGEGRALLDWEYDAELQGGVVVLEDGELRAMVGGSSNADFNRATVARRQFGSTWKPVVYEAALQLRWSVLDPLDNRRAVFPYQGQWYWPRPDHEGAPEAVSLAWAGAKSENLASVWLLYHLADRLNPEQFRQVAELVGLYPPEGVARDDAVRRVQEQGVIPTQAKLLEGIYEEQKADIGTDLSFDGLDREAAILATLPWGLGYDDERQRVDDDESLDSGERALRRAVLARNFLRQESLATRLAERFPALDARGLAGEPPLDAELSEFSMESASLIDPALGGPRVSFGDFVPDGFVPMDAQLWETLRAMDPSPLRPDAVVLEGLLSSPVVARVRAAVDAARTALGEVDLYDFDVLQRIPEFRVLAGIRYVVDLSRRSGVRSPVQPVLSLPLGSSDVTLLEAAQLYSVMLSGQTWRFDPDPLAADPSLEPRGADLRALGAAPAALLARDDPPAPDSPPDWGLIQEIRLPDGRVIYRAARSAEAATDADANSELAGVLESVVAHGTGQRAFARIRLESREAERAARLRELDVRVPLFGKTGTSNAYRNATFVGIVPGLPAEADRLRWGHGHVIASYVGYDDNREMKRGAVRLAGATGSLPVWLEVAEAVVRDSELGDRVDLADAAFSSSKTLPMDWPDSFVETEVSARSGLPLLAGANPGEESVRLRHRKEPAFAPYRPREGDGAGAAAGGKPAPAAPAKESR